MSEWIVYSKDSHTERCTVKKLEYNGEWLGACNLNVTVTSPTPINFELGDYLVYRGERFEINYDPTVIKVSSVNTYGEGFKYENIIFNSLSDELTRCDFLDYVPSDKLIHYSSLPNFSFFADTIEKLAERIKVNLDRIYTGEKEWTIITYPDNVTKKDVNISVNSITCWEALALVQSHFETNFSIKNRTITIGAKSEAINHLFSYGREHGLVTIEKNAESDQKIITRLRAYGSTKNMPEGYYKDLPNGLSVNNLMLPSFPEDLDPYIDSDNIEELGIREGAIFFDGSNDLEEIYPSLPTDGDINKVLSAEQIEDDGKIKEGEKIEPFTITLNDIGFDINDHLIAGNNASISMKTGMCGGREFEIIKCEKIDSGYTLTCERYYDSGLDLYFPYNQYQINSGDEFVLLNIEMPEKYIIDASERLLRAAKEYLSKNDYVRYSYTPKIDNIYLARERDAAKENGYSSIYDTIKEGNTILFEDEDLGINGGVVIDVLSISENLDESLIPQFEITLRNEKTVGALQKIQNQVKAISSGELPQVRSLIESYGSSIFIRKDKDDRSKGKISSNKALEAGRYVSGVSGAIMFIDKITGKSVAEVDKLYVRMKAYFETLEIKNVNSIGGKQIISPAGSVRLTDVAYGEYLYDEEGNLVLDENEEPIFVEYDGFVRCYFLAEQDGEKIENRFKVGDQMYCQFFNAFEGEGNKISNKYYWRLLVATDNNTVVRNGKECYYFDLSKDICDTDSDMPEVGDVVCQRGSMNNVDRQNFLEFSSVDAFSPSITLFQGVGGKLVDGEWVADYSLVNKEMIQLAVNKSTGRAFMHLYGDMYVGDRLVTNEDGSTIEPNSYLRYSQENGLEVKGKISASSTIGDSDTTFGDFVSSVHGDIDSLQQQIDGAIESFFYEEEPTLENVPAKDWDTEDEKKAHLNDTYTDLTSGRSWRWTVKDGVYGWVEITDTATAEALRLAGLAKDTADGKRRVFTKQPTPPYDEGDLWSRGKDYPLLICVNSKPEGGLFEQSDWDDADNVNKIKEELEQAKAELDQAIKDNAEDLNELNQSLNDTKEYIDGAFADGIITETEKVAIEKYIKQIETVKAETDASYEEVYGNELLLETSESGTTADSTVKIQLKSAYETLGASIVDLITTIQSVILDDKATSDEIASVDFKYDTFNSKYGDYIKCLNAAINYIELKLNSKINQNVEDLGGYSYLKEALKDGAKTEINGGLVQSTLLALGEYSDDGKSFTVWSGTSGIYDETKIGNGIAAWYGGGNIDLFQYYDSTNKVFNVPDGVRAAMGVDRMDGTGYRANGNLWWDENGVVHADPLSFFVGESTVGGLLASFQVVLQADGVHPQYLIPQVPFQSLNVTNDFKLGSGDNHALLKYDAENNAVYVVKQDGTPVNFYSTGGISMYGLGDTSVTSLMDAIVNNLDPATLAVKDGLITVIGNTGSEGITSVTKAMVIEALGFTPYDSSNPSGYITSSALSDYQPLISSSNKLSYSLISGTPDLSVYALKSSLATVATSGSYNDLTNKPTIPTVPTSLKNPYAISWNGRESGSYDGSLAKSFYLPSKLSEFTNDLDVVASGELANYLPLTGGTITASDYDEGLTLKRAGTASSALWFSNNNGLLGGIDISADKILRFNNVTNLYTIYHTGNLTKLSQLTDDVVSGNYLPISTYTASDILTKLKTVDGTGSGLDADLLDGLDSSYYKPLFQYDATALNSSQNLNDYGNGFYSYKNGDNPTNSYGNNAAVFAFGNIRGTDFWQMVFDGNTINTSMGIGVRGNFAKGGWTSWKIIAFTDSNVASATKLQTARTIWGQSFDGTGNVDGVFRLISSVGSGVAYHKILAYPTSPYGLVTRLYNNGNASLQAQRESNDNECFNLILNPSGGNVGIYTLTPSYRLDVNGTLNATTIYQNGTALGSMALKSSLVASDIPSLDWSKITSGKPTTLNGYGITNAYTASEVDTKLSGYLPLTGGTIKGGIRLKSDSSNYGQTIYFGDQSYCYISEPSDDAMKIYASKGVTIDATLSVTGTITGNLNGNATKDGDGNVITSTYLKASSYTAADILAKLKTVDGASSGLDADTLDGTHKSDLLTAASSTSATNLSITVGGTTKTVTDLYAYKATQLENSRTIWGQSFNGTGNVSGALSGATTGSFSSNVTIGGTFAVTGTSIFTGKTTHNGGIGATSGTFSSTLAVTSTSVLSGGVTVGKTTAANGTYKLNVTGKSLLSGDTTIDGNLLVKGGITMYGTDGSATDFLLDATSWSSVTSTSTTQVYTARATSLLTNKLSLVNLSVTSLNSSVTTLNNKIAAIKNALEGISSSSSASAIGAALNTLYNSL